jgi:prevent-host-death family protein
VEVCVRRIAVSVLRERLGDVLSHVATRRERIILTRHGRRVGAIVPMEDVQRLQELDADDGTRGVMRSYRRSWRHVTDSIQRRH